MKKTAFIILPTYNEARNITAVILDIRRYTKHINWGINILVVDSNSPDQTASIVKKMQKKDDGIFLIQRPKEGLGRAYVEGIKWLKQKQHPYCDVVFEMDADRSHDPKYIADFLEQSEKGYDLVIGSRYTAGGNSPGWQKHRRLLSYLGNSYIKYVGGIKKYSDCTSGFRCISMSLIKKINFNRTFPSGYAFQVGLLKEAIEHKAKIKEIPISFYPRRKGESKLKWKDFIENLALATMMRFRE